MKRLEGKVCVITGAAGGIGAESAALFRSEGATVVGVDLAESDTDLSLIADVASEEAVIGFLKRAHDEYGRIDVLFNNAGISPDDDVSVLDTTLEAWQRVQDVNLRSVFLCCKHGIPYLLDGGGGSVINTASFVAVMGAATSQISYTASKGAVLALVARAGRRVRAPRRARERAVPGAGRHAAAARALRERPGEGGAAADPPADGTLRGGARDRERRALPRLRRVLLRDGVDVHGRRRAVGRVRHP